MQRTDDGGATWTEAKFPCQCTDAYDMPAFGDQSSGVLRVQTNSGGYYGYALLATNDGGNSWRLLRTPGNLYVYAVNYQDAGHLWLFVAPADWGRGAPGPNDSLYHSSNGGTTWTLVQANTPIGYTSVVDQFWVSFVDSLTGYVVQAVQPTGDYPQLLVTHDAGHTWQVVRPQA